MRARLDARLRETPDPEASLSVCARLLRVHVYVLLELTRTILHI